MTENFEVENNDKKFDLKFCEINKNKIICGLKSIVIICCTTGLLLMTTELVSKYLNRQTVVNIKVGKEKYDKIPAITICYPTMVSMEKFVYIFPEYKDKFDEYMKLTKSVTRNGLEDRKFYKYMSDLYFDNFVENSKVFEIPVYDIFEKLSLGGLAFTTNGTIFYEHAVKFMDSMKVIAKGYETQGDVFVKDITIEDNTPIETINVDYYGKKCFTFFSGLTERFRDFKLELDSIEIRLNHENISVPKYFYDKDFFSLWLSIHSSNTLLDFSDDNYIPIMPGNRYEIVFNSLKTILLEPTYKTNCRYYELNDINHEQMRTDCISKCVNKNLQKTCIKCVYRTGDLLRGIVFKKYKTEKFCNISLFSPKNHILKSDINSYNCLLKNFSKTKFNCEINCQKDCEKIYYDFNIKSELKLSSPWDKDFVTFIIIRHNRLPDQVIQHLPEVELISFISNFGGLLGMWLGLSVYAIFGYLIKNIFKKYKFYLLLRNPYSE